MTFDERNTWTYAAVSLCSFLVYLWVIFARANGAPLPTVAYVSPLLWAIGGAILASIACRIVIATVF